MNKFLSDLAAALARISMTPEVARQRLQRDITFEIRKAQGAYAKAL